ncbi:hypothetical protein QYF36_026037 [Acer negundo]|nr:hypothetical protein QYF36_026037 [Acer negundo]
MENEDSVPPLKSFENKVFDHFLRSSSKAKPQTSQENPAKPSFAAEFKHSNDKRCKMEELEEKDQKSTHSSDKANTRTKFGTLVSATGSVPAFSFELPVFLAFRRSAISSIRHKSQSAGAFITTSGSIQPPRNL